VTSYRLRISGTIDDPVGRNSAVSPAATLAAIVSRTPIVTSLSCRATGFQSP
jgi:hypothetical protein